MRATIDPLVDPLFWLDHQQCSLRFCVCTHPLKQVSRRLAAWTRLRRMSSRLIHSSILPLGTRTLFNGIDQPCTPQSLASPFISALKTTTPSPFPPPRPRSALLIRARPAHTPRQLPREVQAEGAPALRHPLGLLGRWPRKHKPMSPSGCRSAAAAIGGRARSSEPRQCGEPRGGGAARQARSLRSPDRREPRA